MSTRCGVLRGRTRSDESIRRCLSLRAWLRAWDTAAERAAMANPCQEQKVVTTAAEKRVWPEQAHRSADCCG